MKNPFVFRQLQKADAAEVKNLALRSWEYTYGDIYSTEEITEFNDAHYSESALRWVADQLDGGLTQFLVIEDRRADCLVGFAQIGYDQYWEGDAARNNKIVLSRIYLHPEYIGKGLGAQLLARMEQFVREKGHNRYSAMVHQDNNIGLRFYEKMSFTHVSELDDGDEWYMHKVLD